MLEFRFNHVLQLQFNSILDKLGNGFVSKDVYVLTDNLLIALGRPFSIGISLKNGEVTEYESYESWDIADDASVSTIEKDTIISDLFRFIIMRLRAYHRIEPYASEYMFNVLQAKLNDSLKYQNIRIVDSDGEVISICINGFCTTIEMAFSNLMNANINKTDKLLADYDLKLANRLMNLMRYEEAYGIFIKAVNTISEDTMMYTELCLKLGEVCYCLDRCEDSIRYYSRCNTKYVGDLEDFYLRLGHAITYKSNKTSGSMYKLLYMGRLNPNIIAKEADEFSNAEIKVGAKFSEYEVMCRKVGKEYISRNYAPM